MDEGIFGLPHLRRRTGCKRRVDNDVAVAQQTLGFRAISRPAMPAANAVPAKEG
jgi:hypothetical protein